MAQLYSKQQLREIFQSPFNQEAWKAILHNLFRAELIRKQAEKFTAEDDNEDGFYLGALDTSDSFHIGLFYFVIKTGSVAHKKVGLRNLVKQFVNPTWGEFDAAIVVFNDTKEWRLSFVCDIKDVKTTPKRYTFVFGEHDNFYRTAIDRFLTIQNSESTFENIRKAFSVEALSDDFFDSYREQYADFVQYITGKRYFKEGNKWVEREIGKPNFQYTTTFGCDDKLVRDYIKKMFGRIVFLYFLQRKGWLNGDRQYMHNLFYNSTKKDNFLDGVLEPLFFEVLNTDKQYRSDQAKELPGSDNIPYLNGGLFACDEIDELDCVFPEEYFKKLFDFLDSYNFTIDENDVDDAEIGIDPEMLGRIFENLLEDNKDKGAFYTPKEIVNYMCRESLIAYLQNGLPERSHELIRNFVENCDASQLNAEQNKYLRKKLQDVKICDPAIGSGAFPMGLVNILSRLYIAMKADTDTSKMKRHIIENNIYGVDIEKGAVDIARLRFWLAMIVEEKEPMPLPNLHFKIMQGNSLLENYNGIPLVDLTETEVKKEPGTLDFDYDTTEQKGLVAYLSSYYGTSDHNKRDTLFNDIIKNVRRQISYKNITLPSGFDPSANDKFFLWHTWFKDVFDKGGFDIVIGNPPYISTKGVSAEDKKLFTDEYGFSDDTYNHFFFRGIDLCKNSGCLAYITPKTFWTTQTKRNLRDLILSNTLLTIFDTANPFSTAMVDTCVTIIKKVQASDEHKVTFLDGTESLSHPVCYTPVYQSVFVRTQNSVIFKPTELNMRIWTLFGDKVKQLYDTWWARIKTSRDIEKSKDELMKYRQSLKPGDIALLGCLTEGGQGLATANNGKYIAVRRSTKWANNIIASRPKKLADVVDRYKPTLPGLVEGQSISNYLSGLSELEIASLFDSLKEQYGRDIFGQGYIFRIIDDSEIADVSQLTDDEKENGIDTSNRFYVPYDKGDKDGNRWYLETPFAIAWSKENVRFLKTNSGKKGQGMPVVRNPQFYFREGLCWNNVLNPEARLLKAKLKAASVNDVGSMSLMPIEDFPSAKYIIALLNSNIIFDIYREFINCSVNIQINDIRLLPIIIPSNNQHKAVVDLVDKAISLKIKEVQHSHEDISHQLHFIENEIDKIVSQIYFGK